MARGANTTNKPLVWGAAQALEQFKYEVAQELGVPPQAIQDGYWGELPSRVNGAVGGHMVRRMIAAAEQTLIQQAAAGVQTAFRQQLNQPLAQPQAQAAQFQQPQTTR